VEGKLERFGNFVQCSVCCLLLLVGPVIKKIGVLIALGYYNLAPTNNTKNKFKI